ncbi:MAG: hypothetical protein DMF61_23380 [Blastocatellia bacterium AA13]|nr:MAG: hypothetical protein DMF61_23380 [Blastocatellia bacterium AA13]
MEFEESAHALLIGIGKYKYQEQGLAELPSCPNDLRELASLLTDSQKSGYLHQNVSVLSGKEATKKKIESELAKLSKRTNEDSTVFIYFSGHGGRVKRARGVRTYLCPFDCDPDHLADTGISGEGFSNALSAIKARKLLVILDTCHAAGSATLREIGGETWHPGIDKSYLETLAAGSGRVVIASSKADQPSYNHPTANHGLFTWHLLEGLRGKASIRGDGRVNVLDLFYHISEEVRGAQPGQEPVLQVKDLDDNFAIALATVTRQLREPVVSDILITIREIREMIVTDPKNGAKALSELVSRTSRWQSEKSKIDLKRSALKNALDEIDLLGPGPEIKVEKNRAIHSLLSVCNDLERDEAQAPG